MATEFARSQATGLSYVGPMLGCYQKYTPKPPNIAELKTALLSIWKNMPQEFNDKAILSFRKSFKRLRSCVAAAGGHFEHTTFSLNTERAADIRHGNV